MTLRVAPPLMFGSRRALRLIERNLYVYRRTWIVIVSGFFEPLFYLLSIGFGLGQLVGSVPGPGGREIPYQLFIAPALLASSSMNGAITEATLNFFFKLKYQKTFESILSTPLSVADIALGELGWALIRGALYTLGFLGVMVVLGIGVSPWLVLTVPAALLISFAFGAVGMAATSFMRTWQDFDLIQLVVLPMFLFSGTFYPLDAYPDAVRTDRAADAALPGRRPAPLACRRGRWPERHRPCRVPGGHGDRGTDARVAAARQAAAQVGGSPGRSAE